MHVDEMPGSGAIGGTSRGLRGVARYGYAGRHHVADDRWAPIRGLFGPGRPGRLIVATGVICCLGYVAVSETRAATDSSPSVVGAASQSALVDRAGIANREASRSMVRASPQAVAAPTKAKAAPKPAKPTPKPTPKKTAAAKKPAKPVPVAGLSQAQMDNAAIIVQVGLAQKMAKQALIIAIATAMQESDLYNLASDVLPESFNYPHQGSGSDHDSVGLFQQRPSSGWGTIAEIMRPAYAAGAFYAALREVIGWQTMSLAGAAQAVQVSAFPDAYAQHEVRATDVVNALT
jgi:hypothetical protein